MTITLLETPGIFGRSIEVYFILLIIALATFFFSKLLLKKFTGNDQKRIAFSWLATIILTPIIYSGLISIFIFSLSYIPGRDFEKTEWLTNRLDRFEMANDIIKSKMLINKDTNDVKEILGEPILRGDSAKMWAYDMGFGSGAMGFLFHHLDLKFDNAGKVIAVEHVKIRD